VIFGPGRHISTEDRFTGGASIWKVAQRNAEDQADLRDLEYEAKSPEKPFCEHVDPRVPGTSDRLKQMARSFIEQKNVNLTGGGGGEQRDQPTHLKI